MTEMNLKTTMPRYADDQEFLKVVNANDPANIKGPWPDRT